MSLPYADPDAPKGGRVVTGNVGGFDTLNPFTLKGEAPWQLRELTHEALMGRSWDEPFTLYGLLAESVATGPNREWVEFTLREEARFSDGSPVTVEDVIWSYETLGTEGHPRYRGFWSKVASVEATGPRSVRLSFQHPRPRACAPRRAAPDPEKGAVADPRFRRRADRGHPVGSGPYVVADYEIGRHVTLERNPDYWGRDLPFRRGTHNFDEIRIEYFGDNTVLREAFKARTLSYLRASSMPRTGPRNTIFPPCGAARSCSAKSPTASPPA
ncbi:MAG: ABC transporter substrate-binding protein [Roseovarius sp.]|nr:ABC transporter substrate-binding protein [Roseovarius sp.]